MKPLSDTLRRQLTEIVGAKQLITKGARLKRNSRDAYWYSPILKAQLGEKSAELIIQPRTIDQLVATIAQTRPIPSCLHCHRFSGNDQSFRRSTTIPTRVVEESSPP